MPKKKSEINELGITKVSVVSRRSGKVNASDFLTFECMLESDTTGLSSEDLDKRLKDLWAKAHEEVDAQFTDAIDSLK